MTNRDYEVEITYRVFRKGQHAHFDSGWSERRPLILEGAQTSVPVETIRDRIDAAFPIEVQE